MPIHAVSKDPSGELGVDICAAELACGSLPKRRLPDAGVPAREWACDRTSHIGTLARGLDEAGKRRWMVVDMRQDWKVIYPFQK